MKKKDNGSTRSFATRVIVVAFSLAYLGMAAAYIACILKQIEPPTEMFMASSSAMIAVTQSIVTYYFLAKKRPEDKTEDKTRKN